MEHTEVKLSKKSVFSTNDGKHYVEMYIPEGWSINIKENRDIYGGYPYPYTFRVWYQSPDNTVRITYFSPRRYIDDHLLNFKNGQTDDYGNLLYVFEDLDRYLDNWARKDLKEFENVAYTGPIVASNMAQQEADRKKEAIKKATNKGRNLNWYYYKRMCRAYSYRYKGTERVRVYAGIIEAEDVSEWSPIPEMGGFMMDPFMRMTMQSVFKDMHYDANKGAYVRLTLNETGWTARQLFTLDCKLEDYEFAYRNIFDPIRKNGVGICDDIWNDYRQMQKEIDAKKQRLREEKREVARIQREANEQSRQSRQELYDYVRKTQQETHDILNSSYENHRKSQAKVREMWGDVNQGNTRFVDKYGNEHVIHTYDNYAYKSGDTYVTSNDPLDHSYDWEELKKKKY